MTSSSDDANPKQEEPKEVARRASPEVLTAEFVEATKRLNVGQIQVNVLLQQIAQRAPSTEELVAQTSVIIDLAARDAELRLKFFRETASAVIDAKTKDPDEIAKR